MFTELSKIEIKNTRLQSLRTIYEFLKACQVQNLTNETLSSFLKIIDINDAIGADYTLKLDLSEQKEDQLLVLKILSKFTLPQLNAVVLHHIHGDQSQDTIALLTNSFTQSDVQTLEVSTNPTNAAKLDISQFVQSIAT